MASSERSTPVSVPVHVERLYDISVPSFRRERGRVRYLVSVTRPADGTGWVLTKRFSEVREWHRQLASLTP